MQHGPCRFHREREAQPLVVGGQAGGGQAAGAVGRARARAGARAGRPGSGSASLMYGPCGVRMFPLPGKSSAAHSLYTVSAARNTKKREASRAKRGGEARAWIRYLGTSDSEGRWGFYSIPEVPGVGEGREGGGVIPVS
jgi:hypothetical protein